MSNVTIIGTGTMAHAIGGVLAGGGSTVTYLGRGEPGTVDGDIVVLAVPYPAVADVLGTYGPQLAGKVVVDITNPLDFATFDSLVVAAGSSAAAEIAAALPDSHVLKAFNTTFAATLTSGTVNGTVPTTVLVAGDDNDAKAALAAAVEAGGLQALDAGSLARAHELEALGFLQLTLAVAEKTGWTGGFGLVK